ncbi:hypothetical protein AXG93_1913s1860 [Marchantia polymorpha subsp. ruderalis]|uniref:Uncharacterized protein n=1 Tax=Marchantia polymorpha subsp. ruderalis TaxID=1480154 RepID=A0A176WJP3_MARPO|nr:hypothetical protein AXG93_1913s1860 [Marchantia polymorpha subsp. ruderalis]
MRRGLQNPKPDHISNPVDKGGALANIRGSALGGLKGSMTERMMTLWKTGQVWCIGIGIGEIGQGRKRKERPPACPAEKLHPPLRSISGRVGSGRARPAAAMRTRRASGELTGRDPRMSAS